MVQWAFGAQKAPQEESFYDNLSHLPYQAVGHFWCQLPLLVNLYFSLLQPLVFDFILQLFLLPETDVDLSIITVFRY